jgi:hypothetical protein
LHKDLSSKKQGMVAGKEFIRVKMAPEILFMKDLSEKQTIYGTSLRLETKLKINSCIKRSDKQACV